VGVRELNPAGSLRFSHFDQVIQAALDGQGVALGRLPLIDNLLKERRLVAPLRGKYTTPRAYYVVRGAQSPIRPEAQSFIDWLIEETRADKAAADTSTEAQPVARRRRVA
jgi:DNA-binding transcriptional LysR family regulator